MRKNDKTKQEKKALLASLIGSSIEWFDFFLYGTSAAIVFNKLFFPNEDPFIALMLSYLSFGIPFFIRPLGGIIFSHIGDKIGRKKTLVITLTLMGAATVCIGLLPTYQTIGLLAPILLIILRVIQGLGIGGEWGGALLLAVEYAPKEKKGFFGSIPQIGVTIGMLLGTSAVAAMTVISGDGFIVWGWRVPFILSAVLVLIGLWIRNGLDETPDFKKVKESGHITKVPLFDTLKYHWREVLIATGAKFAETGPFYIFSTFIVSYGTSQLALPNTSVLNAVTIATFVTTGMIPLMGILSDKIGRKRMYTWGVFLLLVYAFPYFLLLNKGTMAAVVAATIIGLGILWAPVTAVLGTLFSELFSTNVRYTGITLGYQLGAALAGGTAPLIATYLMREFHGSWIPVALYIVVTCIISLLSIATVSSKKMMA
ncbi:MFS transporter [Bacillus chungangensis]|uniref:Metabolite-proton symporter n=1 Tax=Bacillus chungangensis TaxID=587633 RepID=A0ABT9WXJ1_9BACI|nr:MFS transporter [Bacillus chungangensis]MDQ0178014.1 metabolite-proton symporter [Bacillus chungangensis]